MASLFKPTIISYHLPDGRKVPKGTPGARKKRTKARNWYAQFRDADGRLKRVPLCPDKAAARDILAKEVSDAAKGRAGLTDPFAGHRRKPLAAHLTDYLAYLRGKRNSEAYVTLARQRIEAVTDGCGFKMVADLSASRVIEFLATLRKEPGLSVASSNHYLRAVKGFSRWLVRDRRTGDDVLAHLAFLNVQTDRRHERRALTDDEFSRLLGATREAKPWRLLTGAARHALYLVAATTGYRARELASVTPASFDLDSDHPTLTVKAGYSKHRREDVQPLHPVVVPILREFLKGIDPEARVWPGSWANHHAAEMLRIDLEAAGIPYRDAAGRVFDFHSLRGQYITSLGRAGVPLVTAQKLARHSDPKLTANVYTHLAMVDLAAAVESLPIRLKPLALPLALTHAVAG